MAGLLLTQRLILRPAGTDEAERIATRRPGPDDLWAPDFPFDGDVIGATMFLRATTAYGDQHPFGHYVIVSSASRRAIGGIGSRAGRSNGTAEIGYGLAPSGRGNGFAAEAAIAVITLARAEGLSCLVADTASENMASRKTLQRAGFVQTGASGDLVHYAISL